MIDSLDRGMEVALAAASLSNAPRTALRMGAALYSGPRLLSIGANTYGKTHPDSANTREFCRNTHAEMGALLKRKHYDGDSRLTLYVARQKANGHLACSEPCENCKRLAKIAGVKRVCFLDEQGKVKETKL